MVDVNLPPTQIYKFPDGTEVTFRALSSQEHASILAIREGRDHPKKSVARLIESAVIEPCDARLLLRDLLKLKRITAADMREFVDAILEFSSLTRLQRTRHLLGN